MPNIKSAKKRVNVIKRQAEDRSSLSLTGNGRYGDSRTSGRNATGCKRHA